MKFEKIVERIIIIICFLFLIGILYVYKNPDRLIKKEIYCKVIFIDKDEIYLECENDSLDFEINEEVKL